MNRFIFAIVLLISTAAIFELLPAVETARSYVSFENYQNNETACDILLQSRPWYGKVNHWFFMWLLLTPLIMLSIKQDQSAYLREGSIILSFVTCYLFLNLAIHLQWEIRNAPFREAPYNPHPLNGWRMDCADYAGDGFSYVLASTMAWIPAGLYTGFCLFLKNRYLIWRDNLTTDKLKPDIIGKILFMGIKIYCALLVLCAICLGVFEFTTHFTGTSPFDPDILIFIKFFLIRPLFIPVEIFYY